MHLDNQILNQLQDQSNLLERKVRMRLERNGKFLQDEVRQLCGLLDEWRSKTLLLNEWSIKLERDHYLQRKEYWKNELASREREFEEKVNRFFGSDGVRSSGESILNLLDQRMEFLTNRVSHLETQRTSLRDENTELKEYFANADDLLLEKNTQLNRLFQEKNKLQKLVQTLKTELYKKNKKVFNLERKWTEETQEWEEELKSTRNEKNDFRNKFGKTSKSFKNYKKLLKKKLEQLSSEATSAASKIKWLNRYLQKKQSLWKSAKKKLTNRLDKSKDKIRLLNQKFLQLLKQLRKEKQNHQKTQQEKENYQSKFQQAKVRVNNLQKELADKDQKIQEQAQRIKELENKPPVVSVETQPIEKKIVKEVEKKIEVESPHQKREIERLKKIIQQLKQQLAQPIQPIKETHPSTNIYAERVIIYSLLATASLLLVKISIQKKKKVSYKKWKRK